VRRSSSRCTANDEGARDVLRLKELRQLRLRLIASGNMLPNIWQIMVLGLLLGGGWVGDPELRGDEKDPSSQASKIPPATNENPKDPALESIVPMAPKPDLEGKDIKDRSPFQPWDSRSPDEGNAYWHTVILAHTTTVEAFANSTRRDITFAHLFQEPEKYRGEVVHYEGRLTRVRRFETPRDIKSAYDIPYQYEGWIFDPLVHGANPMCVIFTELPAPIDVKEKLEQYVAFDGYFFKTWRYAGGDHERISPILIGKSPVLKKPAEVGLTDRTITFSSAMITAFLGMVALVIALIIALSVWYRRGDQRIKTRIAEVNAGQFFENEES